MIPGSGRSPGEGNGNPLQYSCLDNSMDRGGWQATVHGVAKSQTHDFDFVLGLHCCTGFSLVVASSGYSKCWYRASHCSSFPCCGAQALRRTGFSSWGTWALDTGSVVVAHQLSCPLAREIFRDQGSRPCLLHWQGYSLPLTHQGSPRSIYFTSPYICL